MEYGHLPATIDMLHSLTVDFFQAVLNYYNILKHNEYKLK